MADGSNNNKGISLSKSALTSALNETLVPLIKDAVKDSDVSEATQETLSEEVNDGIKNAVSKLSQHKIEINPPIYINYNEKTITKQAINQIDKVAKKINKYAEDAFNFPEKSKTLGSLQRTQGTLLPFDDDAIKLRTKGLTTKNIKQLLNKMDADTKSQSEKIIGNIAQVLEFRDRAVTGLKDNKTSDIFDISKVVAYVDSLKDVIRSATVLSDLFKELENYGITSSSFSKRLKIDGFQDEAQKFTKEFEDYKARVTSSWLSMITGASTPEKGITKQKANQIINNHKLLLSAKKSDGNYLSVDDIRAEAKSKLLSERANAIVEKYMQMAMDELENNLSDAFNKATNGKSNTEFVKLYNAYLARGGKQKEKYDEFKDANVQTNTLDYYVIQALRKKNEKPITTSTDSIEATRKAAKQAKSEAANAAGAIAEQSEKTKQKVTDDAKQAANNAQKKSQETKDKVASDQQAVRDEYDKTKKKAEEVNDETQPTTPTESKKPTAKGTAKKSAIAKKGSTKKSVSKKSDSEDTSNSQNGDNSKSNPQVSTEEAIKNEEKLANAFEHTADVAEESADRIANANEKVKDSISEIPTPDNNQTPPIVSEEQQPPTKNKPKRKKTSSWKTEEPFSSSDPNSKSKLTLSSNFAKQIASRFNIKNNDDIKTLTIKIGYLIDEIGGLWNGNKLDFTNWNDTLQNDLVDFVTKKGKIIKNGSGEYDAVLDWLKNKVIYLSDDDRNEINYKASDPRFKNGIIKYSKTIGKGITDVDKVWDELNYLFQDKFPLSISNRADQINHILDIIEIGKRDKTKTLTYDKLDREDKTKFVDDIWDYLLNSIFKSMKTSIEEYITKNNPSNPPSNPSKNPPQNPPKPPKPPKNPPIPNNPPSPPQNPPTPPSNPPKPKKKGRLIKEEFDTINGNWSDTYLDNIGQVHIVGEKINKKTGDPEPFNKIIRSYKDLESEGTASLNKLIEIHKKLKVAQMDDVPNMKYIDALKEERNIYQNRLKLTYDAAKLYSKSKNDYEFSDFVIALRKNSEGKLAESNSYIQKHSGQTNQLAAKVLSKNDIEVLRNKFEQLRISMQNSGADTTLLENCLNSLEKSLGNVSDTKAFNKIKSNFDVLSQQFKTLDSSFKSDQKVYSDQISVIDDLMVATTALNNTQANQKVNPDQDLSETIRRQSEAVNELSVKAGEALVVIEDLFNAGGKISADQVTDATNRLVAASSGSPESQENYNTAKIKAENKAYEDATSAIEKYKNAKSKLLSLKADQLSNSEKDLSKSIKEATEDVKEYGNQAREAYINVQELAKSSSVISSGMVSALRDGLKDASKGSGAAQDKYTNAQSANEKKQIADNLKILKEYHDTQSKLNELKAEQKLSKNKGRYVDEISELETKLKEMESSALSAYDAIQKLNSATSEDKANADKYLGSDGSSKSRRKLNIAKDKAAASEDSKLYKDNLKIIEEYWNKKAELVNLNAKQKNAKNGEDYSSEINKLSNDLVKLEQDAKNAYDVIKNLQNITINDRETAKKLLNEGNDNYRKAQSNFRNAYNKNEFSKEKKALKDFSDAYEEYIKKRIELHNIVGKGVDDETFNIFAASAKDAEDKFINLYNSAKTIVSDKKIRDAMDIIDTKYYTKAEKSIIDISSGYENQIKNVEDKLKNASDNVKNIISDIRTELSDALKLNDKGQYNYAEINKFGQKLKSKLDFAEELNKVENFGDKIAKNIEGGLGSSVGKVEEYSNQLKDFQNQLEAILKLMSNTPPTDIGGIDSYRDQLNSLNAEVTDFLKNKAGFKSVTGKGFLDVDSIGNVTNINDLSDALDKYVAAKKYAKLSAIDLNEATQTATVKIKDENGAVRVLTASIDAYAKAMRVKTGKASSFGLFKDAIDSTGQYITMMLDVGDVVNFVRRNISEAVSTFKEYDDALTNISYTMNMAQEDLENLGQSAINMAEDLSMSIQDAASIYQIYANMNTTAAEIEKTAMPTAILSNLSGVDASTASDQVQGILQQFNMLEDESQNVADVSMHIVDVLDNISSNVAIDYANFIGTYIRNNI